MELNSSRISRAVPLGIVRRIGRTEQARQGQLRATPIDVFAVGSEPGDIGQTIVSVGMPGQESFAAHRGVRAAESNQGLNETQQIGSSVSPAANRTRRCYCPGSRRCCCPCCVRRHSSPATIIGTPWLSSNVASMFLICRVRSSRIALRRVGPSTP